MTIEVDKRIEIEKIESRSHAISIQKENNNLARVSLLNPFQAAFSELIILFSLRNCANIPFVISNFFLPLPFLFFLFFSEMENTGTVEKDKDSAVLMMNLVPKIDSEADPKNEIVFLVDCSGSMAGAKMCVFISFLSPFLPFFFRFELFSLEQFTMHQCTAALLEISSQRIQIQYFLVWDEVHKPLC
jgi:hypothetical protein